MSNYYVKGYVSGDESHQIAVPPTTSHMTALLHMFHLVAAGECISAVVYDANRRYAEAKTINGQDDNLTMINVLIHHR